MFVIISGEVSVAIKKKINVFEEENKKQQKEDQEKRNKTEESSRSIEQPNSATNKDQSVNMSIYNDDDEQENEDNDKDEIGNAGNPTIAILRKKLARKDTQNINSKLKNCSSPKISNNVNKNALRRNLSIHFDTATLGDVVAKLGSGFSFGEKAIMEEGGIRMASIFASSETESLVQSNQIQTHIFFILIMIRVLLTSFDSFALRQLVFYNQVEFNNF